MLGFLIPSAYAQNVTGTVSNTAAAGRDAAVSGATTGVQTLINYVASNIDNWIAGLVIVVIFYILARIASSAIKRAIIKEKEDIQESALILIERVTRMTVVLIGVTIAFAINGLNFTAVIGALSLGIGFALKDIIGNFISGVIMLSQNRVRIGDFIKVNDILGTIVSIDTRATILQAIDGTEVVIPNQTMLGQTLISYTTNPFRRIELVVGVDYKTDLPMVTSLIKGIIDKDKDIVVKPEPMILVDAFGDSSINIVIRFWVESSANWLKIRSNLANRIKQAFDEVGVNIPFPIRTLKLDEDDRSFLKTMDSMKKGYVPEPAAVPSNDEIATAASHTENSVQVPYNLFEGEEKTGQKAPASAIPSTSAAPAAPAPTPAPAPEKPATPKPPVPPPTHL
jgi:small conductance mechanosensitive channel